MPSSPTAIPPKVLRQATDAANQLCHKIRSAYGAGKLKTWGDLEAYGIPFGPEVNRAAPLLPSPLLSFYLVVEPILAKYVAGTEARLREALDNPTPRRKLRLAQPDECRRLGRFTLFREQEPTVAAITDYLYGPSNGTLALIPAGTGAGKTQMMAGVITECLGKNLHNALGIPFPYPVIILTVKNAVYQTIQRLRDCGLGEHIDNSVIHVWPYSALTSSFGRDRLLDIFTVTDPHTGIESQAITYKPFALPVLLVLDECHCLARADSLRTKAVRAMHEAMLGFPILKTKVLALSATPAEKVNDGRLITCMAGITFQNQKITWDNFNQSFATIVAEGDPNVPTKASVTRLFDAWSEIVFEPPYIKWPYKAINSVKLYEFRNQADKEFVDAAVERYLDRISQLGRDTPGDLALQRIALLQLRKSIEPSRAELMVDDMVAEVRKGNTALCGTAFTGTIIRSLFYLLDTYGDTWTRDHVSVIWGGRGDPRPEKILTPTETLELLARDITVKEMRLLQKNLDWQEDRLLFGDVDAEAQDSRYLRLKALGLIGVQSQDIRQAEIEKFQSGRARFCFYTMASGGTGLSLEHCDDRQAPRVGFYTPIYNAKEWVQALGRAHRRNSISDTRQYICLLADTIEQSHVAPRLDLKLRSLGAGFSTSTKDDIFNALLSLPAAELKRKVSVAIRSEEQATIDADDEATQLHTTDIDEEDDDE